MRRIHFKSIAIISRRDKKGFIFEFTPKINMVFGVNDTGKSSLIKALYFTLGGDCRIDNDWKNDDIISKVTINVREKCFTFIRHKKRISIFSHDKNKLIVSSVHRSDIANKIKEIFDFNLQLSLKKTGELSQANPACLFLPFYIDQDDGWHTVLSSFSGLAMYEEWQKNTIQFHSGIKPKEYYELMGKIRLKKIELDENNATLEAVLAAKKRFEESFGRVLFDIDIDYYQKLLDRFLEKCQKLNVEESKFRLKLIELLSKRDAIASEIEVCKDTLTDFNDSEILDTIEKYHMFENRENLLKVLPEMYEEKQKIENEIGFIKEELHKSKNLSAEIYKMMQEVKGKLTLNDVIKSQASKEVEFTFDEQIRMLQEKIGRLKFQHDELTKKQNKYTDKKRTKTINDDFKAFLSRAQNQLGIASPVIAPLVQYSKITKSKTGSRSPRAIFAYHYALLKTIEKHSTVSILPIVIDSPKQQDLDREGTEKLISLCIEDLGQNNQIIIGAVSLEKNMHGYHQLELKKKYSLLVEESYNKAYSEIMPLYEKGIFS